MYQGKKVLVAGGTGMIGKPLVEMLERLIVRSDGPLLLLATARPEFAETQPGFPAGREGATSISLKSLSESQAAALVGGLLRAAELPEELAREIVRTAEGNPFFLEEIVLRLIDTGAIVQEGDRWRAEASAGRLGIPDTVHGVLGDFTKFNLGMIANRWTFYIGKDGKILAIDKTVKPATSAEDMAAKLGELKIPATRGTK